MKKLLLIRVLMICLLVGCSNHEDSMINNQRGNELPTNRTSNSLEDGSKALEQDKTKILQKGVFKDSERIEYSAVLVYDGEDVRLKVNNAETVVESYASEQLQQNTFIMKFFLDSPLIAIINHFQTMHGHNVNLNMYLYDQEKIKAIFTSLNDLECNINNIAWDRGDVTIDFPLNDIKMTYHLTNNEKKLTDSIVSELKENQITLNEEYIKLSANNIASNPIDIAFYDVDKDGYEEILLLSNISTVGAKTPVHINTNVVLVLEVSNNAIALKEVLTNNDLDKYNALLSSFQYVE